MGGEKLKSVCSQCNINKWAVDFKEGSCARISSTSVCLSCEQAALIEEQKKEIESLKIRDQQKEDRIRTLEEYVRKIEKFISKEGEKAKSEVTSLDNSNSNEAVKVVEKKVEDLSKVVKENRDDIVETGRQVVEIRKEIASSKESRNFQVVSGRKLTKVSDKKQGIAVTNRFALLEDEADAQEVEAYVIGDSIVREQNNHFAKKNKQRRKVQSYPGCKAKTVIDKVNALKVKNDDTCIIANAGSNDLYLREGKIGNSEPLVQDLKNLVDSIAEKTSRGILVGILPRIHVSYCAMSKAIGINRRLSNYCSQKNVEFIDVWETFVNKRQYFRRDGIHLNWEGHKKLGEIMCQEYDKVKNKVNLSRKTQEQSPTQAQESLAENSFVGFPPNSQPLEG